MFIGRVKIKTLIKSLSRLRAGIRYRLREARWARRLITSIRRGPTFYSQKEHNFWYLYIEVLWVAVLSAAASFNATYALRLGATNAMVGWLSSIPALIAMVILIPSARFLESKSNRAPWILWSLFIGRLAFLGTVIFPWVFNAHRAEAVVWLLILRTIPLTFFNAGFSPMLADIVPERDRARVFANRSIILSAGTAVTTFIASWWLDQAAHIQWAAFPTNYQIVYFFGAVGALMSVFYLFKIKAPPSKVIRRTQNNRRQKPFKIGRATLPRVKAAFKEMLTENQVFVRLTLNTLVFNLGAWLVMPLYTIFFVRELNASDGWIGLNSTLANIGVIVGYMVWRRSVHKLGNHRALLISIPLSASYAFLVSFFPNLSAILVWGVLINLVNPGVNLSHTNILYELCPEDRRASYMAIYSSIMNAGAFIGPMVGVALAEVLDIRLMLIIGGVIRLAGALLFHFIPLQQTKMVQVEDKQVSES